MPVIKSVERKCSNQNLVGSCEIFSAPD